jgi:hypothetical protein
LPSATSRRARSATVGSRLTVTLVTVILLPYPRSRPSAQVPAGYSWSGAPGSRVGKNLPTLGVSDARRSELYLHDRGRRARPRIGLT